MDNENNYGVTELTLDTLDYLVHENNTGLYGPVFEENGRYVITTIKKDIDPIDIPETLLKDPNSENYYGNYYEVSTIIDKSTSPEEAGRIISNKTRSFQKTGEYANSSYSSSDLIQYTRELESKTGRTIGHVEVNSDNTVSIYDSEGNLLIDGATPKKTNDSSSIYQYDTTDEVSAIGAKNLYNPNETLTSKTRNEFESYFKEFYAGKKYKNKTIENVELINNNNGTYSLVIDGETVNVFNENDTLLDAVTRNDSNVNPYISDEFDLPNKDPETPRLKNKTGQGYEIHIDELAMNEASGKHEKAKVLLEECGGLYNTSDLKDKLLAAYEEMVGAGNNTNPKTRIDKTNELLDNVLVNVKYSLEAYHNIDHRLGVILTSVIDEIFRINSYHNISNELAGLTLEEKEERLSNIIVEFETQLQDLESEYNEKYGGNIEGAHFPEEFTCFVLGIADAFNLDVFHIDVTDNTAGSRGESPYDFEGTTGTRILSIDGLMTTMNFIKDNDLITKLTAYSNSESANAWVESGLSAFNANILSNITGYDETSNNDLCERRFLVKYANHQSDLDSSSIERRLNGGADDTDIILTLRGHLGEQLKKTVKFKNNEGEEVSLDVFGLYEYYTQERTQLGNDILTLKNTIYNYKQYQALMPYEYAMRGENYMQYLTKDWGDISSIVNDVTINDKLRYMSHSEIALYMMYKESGEEEKADGYLEAMTDLINQRHGYEEAAELVYKYSQWVAVGNEGSILNYLDMAYSVFDSNVRGMSNGLDRFFEGIDNVFDADGKRSALDYRNLYIMTLLSEDDCAYNSNISPELRAILKRSYTVGTGVGQLLIPAMARFVPYFGEVLSPVLMGGSILGSSTENAMQIQMERTGTTNPFQAYLYGAASAGIGLWLNRKLSGIIGLNGSTSVPNNLSEYALNAIRQSGRSVIGLNTDTLARWLILGEPLDFSNLPANALEAAFNGALVAGELNLITSFTIKLADGITVQVSGGKYQNYNDFLADAKEQVLNSLRGKNLLLLAKADNDIWQKYAVKNPNSVVTRWIKEAGNSPENALIDLTDQENIANIANQANLVNVTDQADRIIEGETYNKYGGGTILYDQKVKSYYWISPKGSIMAIPQSMIPNGEPLPIQAPVQENVEPINNNNNSTNDYPGGGSPSGNWPSGGYYRSSSPSDDSPSGGYRRSVTEILDDEDDDWLIRSPRTAAMEVLRQADENGESIEMLASEANANTSEANANAARGHLETRVALAIDENGEAIPQYTSVWIEEPSDSPIQGSIQHIDPNFGLDTFVPSESSPGTLSGDVNIPSGNSTLVTGGTTSGSTANPSTLSGETNIPSGNSTLVTVGASSGSTANPSVIRDFAIPTMALGVNAGIRNQGNSTLGAPATLQTAGNSTNTANTGIGSRIDSLSSDIASNIGLNLDTSQSISSDDAPITLQNASNTTEKRNLFQKLYDRVGEWVMKDDPLDQGSDVSYRNSLSEDDYIPRGRTAASGHMIRASRRGEDINILNGNSSSDNSSGHYEAQTALAIDEDGNTISTTTRTWVDEPSNQLSQGSIQQIQSNSDSGTDTYESNLSDNPPATLQTDRNSEDVTSTDVAGRIDSLSREIINGSNHGFGSVQFNEDDNTYTFDDYWDGVTVSADAMTEHLSNIHHLSEHASYIYLKAIARDNTLLQNPPQDITIFEDENYGTFTQRLGFGYDMTREADTGTYHYNGVSIPKGNMKRLVTAITSKMDGKLINGISRAIIDNPDAINYRVFDYVSDSEFSSLYGTLGKSMFTSGFNEIMANSSISDVEDAVSSPKMAPIKEKLDWFATKGIDIFNSDFVENFSVDEISQLGNILTSKPYPKLDDSYAQTMINSHNYALLHDILEYIDLGQYQQFSGIPDFTGHDLSNITSIYDGELIPDKHEATALLIYRLAGKNIIVEEGTNSPNVYVKNGNGKVASLSQLIHGLSIHEFVRKYPTLFNDGFIAEHSSILRIQELIDNFYSHPNSELADVIVNLAGDNYLDLIDNLAQSVYRIISEDYATQVSQAYDSIETPTHMVDGVVVHDVTDQDFTMLVHSIIPERDGFNSSITGMLYKDIGQWGKITGGNPNVSLSLITNKNRRTFGNDGIILGFSDISGHNVSISKLRDAGTNVVEEITPGFAFDASVHEPFNELAIQRERQNIWNEVTVNRYDADGNPLMPTYLVCFDKVTPEVLNAARVLGTNGNPLPIYVIHGKTAYDSSSRSETVVNTNTSQSMTAGINAVNADIGNILSTGAVPEQGQSTPNDNTQTTTNTLDANNRDVQVIDVSQINTGRYDTSKLARGVDPNVLNMSYKGYNFVYKTAGNVTTAINNIVRDNKNGQILLELDNTIGLTAENLAQLPSNVKIRILGDYGLENFRGFASNDSGLSSLRNVTYSIPEMEGILKIINNFEKGINPNWNSVTKAKYAYNFLKNNIKYNPKPLGGNTGRAKQFDGLVSLLAKESTCQGFAHTYKELLDRMGIECTEISGQLDRVGQHAFNVVNIDGKNIIVDTTREFLGEGYDGSGFGTDYNQYWFRSNKDLATTLTTIQNINIKDEQPTEETNNSQSMTAGINAVNADIGNIILDGAVPEQGQSTPNDNTQTTAKEEIKPASFIIDSYLNGKMNEKSMALYKDMDDLIRETFEVYLNLAPNVNSQNILSEILFNGEYGNLTFHSTLSTEGDIVYETARRLSMAQLYLTNPKTFMTLAKNGINLFHGTSSSNLVSILENGLQSGEIQVANGRTVSTGEVLSRHGKQRNFVSFSDMLDVSYYYSRLDYNNYGIILCTNEDSFTNSGASYYRRGFLSEISVKNNYPIDKISSILVPSDKVDYVKLLVGDRDIQVLPFDNFEPRPYVIDYFRFFEDGIMGRKQQKSFIADEGVAMYGGHDIANDLRELISKNYETNKADYEINSPIDNQDNISTTTEEISQLINSDTFNSASFTDQKQMITSVPGYDSLSNEIKIAIFTSLLEKSAYKQGLTIKELASLSGEGVTSPEVLASAQTLAQDKANKASKIEPNVTSIVKSFEDDDAMLVGLDHKLKSPERIAEKTIFESNRKGIKLEDAVLTINDALRYTMLISPNKYVSKSLDVLRKFQEQGYTVIKATNSWNSPEYKGLNTVLKSSDGTVFELQFHTPDSYDVKEVKTHLFYEIRRNSYVQQSDKDLAKEIQRIYTSELIPPEGVIGLDYMGVLEETNPKSSDLNNTSSPNTSLLSRLKNRLSEWVMKDTPLDQGSDVTYNPNNLSPYGKVQYVVDILNRKYNSNYGMDIIQQYIENNDLTYITRDGNCRNIIESIPIADLKYALKQLEAFTTSQTKSIVKLSQLSYQDVVNKAHNMMSYPGTISLIEKAVNGAIANGTGTYSSLVSINSPFVKTLPTEAEINYYKNRFSDSGKYEIDDQHNMKVFSHISTNDFYEKCNVTDRLYINTNSCSDTINFVTMFADKCEQRGIPFYFKTAYMFDGADKINPNQLKRDESIVIYSDSRYLSTYYEICNEIKNSTGMQFGKPPILSGVIDGYIGYGSEPRDDNSSFNSIRASLIEISINSVNEKFAGKYGYNITNTNGLNSMLTMVRQDNKLYYEYLNTIYDTIYANAPSFDVDPNSFFMNLN